MGQLGQNTVHLSQLDGGKPEIRLETHSETNCRELAVCSVTAHTLVHHLQSSLVRTERFVLTIS